MGSPLWACIQNVWNKQSLLVNCSNSLTFIGRFQKYVIVSANGMYYFWNSQCGAVILSSSVIDVGILCIYLQILKVGSTSIAKNGKI